MCSIMNVFVFILNHFLTLVWYSVFSFFGFRACGILVPWPGIEPMPPAVDAQSLNHWTAREVPASESLQKKKSLYLSDIRVLWNNQTLPKMYNVESEHSFSLERTLFTFYNQIFSIHMLEFYVFHWKGIMPHTLLLIFNFYLVLQFYWDLMDMHCCVNLRWTA